MVAVNVKGKWRVQRPDGTLLEDEFETKQAAQHRADLIRVMFYDKRPKINIPDDRHS